MSSFKDYFTFDKRQRNGAIILLFLIILAVVARLMLPYHFNKEVSVNSDFQERIRIFEKSVINEELGKSKISEQAPILFDFNPNNLSKEKWLMLGLKEWQVKTIHNYESKGGQFRKKEDVKKIYGIKKDLYDQLEPHIIIPESDLQKTTTNYKKEISLFQFNPNHLEEDKWKMLGLKDWQIRIIYNFESKGGQFRTKDDVGKIYGIKPELFNKWKPYIVIPGDEMVVKVQLTSSSKLLDMDESNFKGLKGVSFYQEQNYYKYTVGELHSEPEAKLMLKKVKEAGFDSAFLIAFKNGKKVPIKTAFNKSEKTSYKKDAKEEVELNSADSSLLVTIYGIGPTFAQRILKQRYKFGGFLELVQLKDVYGITDENYSKISEQLTLDTSKMIKININECSWGRLVGHPYISKNAANGIINYRKQHGNYKTVADIQGSNLVSEELYLKIAPYLKIE